MLVLSNTSVERLPRELVESPLLGESKPSRRPCWAAQCLWPGLNKGLNSVLPRAPFLSASVILQPGVKLSPGYQAVWSDPAELGTPSEGIAPHIPDHEIVSWSKDLLYLTPMFLASTPCPQAMLVTTITCTQWHPSCILLWAQGHSNGPGVSITALAASGFPVWEWMAGHTSDSIC